MEDYLLSSEDRLTRLAKEMNLLTWNSLTEYVRSLPYGRNQSRSDFSFVLIEQKGTCSSKHALLKSIADSNSIQNVELMLCIYRMNGVNTKGIGDILILNNLPYIPEAHCYLRINEEKFDFTSAESSVANIEEDVLDELSILPNQVVDFKNKYHKNYLQRWIEENNLGLNINQLWAIREECISKLSE